MALMQSTRLNISAKSLCSGVSRRAVRTQALFGWGNKSSGKSQKELEKEEMYRQQQELLEMRRAGRALQGANERRAKVAGSTMQTLIHHRILMEDYLQNGEMECLLTGYGVQETVASRKAARRAEREALARGEMPDSLREWRNYKNKEDETATSGLVVPLLPFGMPKYDAGERFDLRSPYADDGWVDPEETDAWAGFKKIGEKLLNFTGKTQKQETKPIIWASQYDKYVAEQKAAKAAAKKGKK